MAFKEPIDNKRVVFRTKKNVRVKKSYYTFSKEYPVGDLGKKKLRSRKRREKYRKTKFVLASVGLILLFSLSYFLCNLAFDFSYKAIELDTSNDSSYSNEVSSSLISNDEIKALYMPSDKVDDFRYINSLIKEVKKKNGNSVTIDFKTKEGRLIYTSKNNYSLSSKAAMYDNDTIRKAIDLFEQHDIAVIANVYCFEDNLLATKQPDFAVKYMDTQVNWLDDLSENGGKAWLNPYIKEVRLYLVDIIKEVLSFDVSGIILKSVQYPKGKFITTATYPDEPSTNYRNSTLLNFINVIKSNIPENKFLILQQDSVSVLDQNNEIYSGSVNEANVDLMAVDVSKRNEKYIIDSKTDYVSILSLMLELKANTSEEGFIFMLNKQEYSWWLMREFSKNDYDSFIIYDENGKY